MNVLQKMNPEWALRLGLGFMFAYSGYDIIAHPSAWQWVVVRLPQFIQGSINQIGVDTYLRVQGGGELVLAFVLLAWFLPRVLLKWVALLIVLEMAVILLFVGVDAITFRDIGLLGAAIALFLISLENRGAIQSL